MMNLSSISPVWSLVEENRCPDFAVASVPRRVKNPWARNPFSGMMIHFSVRPVLCLVEKGTAALTLLWNRFPEQDLGGGISPWNPFQVDVPVGAGSAAVAASHNDGGGSCSGANVLVQALPRLLLLHL